MGSNNSKPQASDKIACSQNPHKVTNPYELTSLLERLKKENKPRNVRVEFDFEDNETYLNESMNSSSSRESKREEHFRKLAAIETRFHDSGIATQTDKIRENFLEDFGNHIHGGDIPDGVIVPLKGMSEEQLAFHLMNINAANARFNKDSRRCHSKISNNSGKAFHTLSATPTPSSFSNLEAAKLQEPVSAGSDCRQAFVDVQIALKLPEVISANKKFDRQSTGIQQSLEQNAGSSTIVFEYPASSSEILTTNNKSGKRNTYQGQQFVDKHRSDSFPLLSSDNLADDYKFKTTANAKARRRGSLVAGLGMPKRLFSNTSLRSSRSYCAKQSVKRRSTLKSIQSDFFPRKNKTDASNPTYAPKSDEYKSEPNIIKLSPLGETFDLSGMLKAVDYPNMATKQPESDFWPPTASTAYFTTCDSQSIPSAPITPAMSSAAFNISLVSHRESAIKDEFVKDAKSHGWATTTAIVSGVLSESQTLQSEPIVEHDYDKCISTPHLEPRDPSCLVSSKSSGSCYDDFTSHEDGSNDMCHQLASECHIEPFKAPSSVADPSSVEFNQETIVEEKFQESLHQSITHASIPFSESPRERCQRPYSMLRHVDRHRPCTIMSDSNDVMSEISEIASDDSAFDRLGPELTARFYPHMVERVAARRHQNMVFSEAEPTFVIQDDITENSIPMSETRASLSTISVDISPSRIITFGRRIKHRRREQRKSPSKSPRKQYRAKQTSKENDLYNARLKSPTLGNTRPGVMVSDRFYNESNSNQILQSNKPPSCIARCYHRESEHNTHHRCESASNISTGSKPSSSIKQKQVTQPMGHEAIDVFTIQNAETTSDFVLSNNSPHSFASNKQTPIHRLKQLTNSQKSRSTSANKSPLACITNNYESNVATNDTANRYHGA
nr:hypothetical protein L203_06620 [Cryptococcus depauperatus CBS 7841]